MSALSTSFSQSAADQIKERLEAIRKEGPETLEELDRWYPKLPPEENAADLLTEGSSRLTRWDSENQGKIPFFGGTMPSRTVPLPEETRALIAQYLNDNQEALKILHKGARMKLCRYPIRLTDGYETGLPHTQKGHHAVRMMALEALFFAEGGYSDRPSESIIDSLGVARSFAKEPILMSQSYRITCHAISISSLEQVINRTVLTDSHLAEISAALDEADDTEALTRAYIGERCMGLDAFSKPTQLTTLIRTQSGNNDPKVRKELPEYASTPSATLDMDKLACLDLMASFIQATKAPLPERLRAAEAVESKIKDLPKSYLMSRVITPVVSGAINRDMRITAKRHTAKTALAVERYRLAKGNLPGQLNDLVPIYLNAVPADLFDGKPLRYKTLDKGYVVYSVGDDGEDNGGAEKNAQGRSFEPGSDITFIVEH